jgi:DNA-binding NarL/FixJ family response regulator
MKTPSRSLTPAESAVMRLLADGLSNALIAERLCITEGTVKKHVYSAFRKLGVGNRVQATNRMHARARLIGHALRTMAAWEARDGKTS